MAIQNVTSEDFDQIARMCRLIWIFAGCICPKVCFLTIWLIIFFDRAWLLLNLLQNEVGHDKIIVTAITEWLNYFFISKSIMINLPYICQSAWLTYCCIMMLAFNVIMYQRDKNQQTHCTNNIHRCVDKLYQYRFKFNLNLLWWPVTSGFHFSFDAVQLRIRSLKSLDMVIFFP